MTAVDQSRPKYNSYCQSQLEFDWSFDMHAAHTFFEKNPGVLLILWPSVHWGFPFIVLAFLLLAVSRNTSKSTFRRSRSVYRLTVRSCRVQKALNAGLTYSEYQ